MHSCPVFQIFHLFFISFPYALDIRKDFIFSKRGGSIQSVKFSKFSEYQKWDYLLIATHRRVNFPRKSRVNFNYKSTADYFYFGETSNHQVDEKMENIFELLKNKSDADKKKAYEILRLVF